MGLYESVTRSPKINIKFVIESKDHIVKLKIIIEDSGPGIPIKIKDTIGKIYNQSNTKSEGSGYGLYSICKMSKHKLKIENSEKLYGAKITFVKDFIIKDGNSSESDIENDLGL